MLIGANRDEMVARSWEGPAEFWPELIGGRDRLGGGTWMALNRHGVMAAVLNRHGSLGGRRPASAAGGSCRYWRCGKPAPKRRRRG